jgi:hypothetical protein
MGDEAPDDRLLQKVIDGLVKAAVAALTGGGILKLSSTWVGEAAFAGFPRRLGTQLTILGKPTPDLLEAWSGQVLAEAVDGLDTVLIVLLGALLILVGHVVFRGNLEAADRGDGEPASGRAVRLRRLYCRWHFGVTLALFFGFAVALWFPSSRPVMVTAFALLMIPGLLYLVLYAADVRRPRFVPRFTWIACALLTLTALFGTPRVYGAHFFDVPMIQVEREDGTVAHAFKDADNLLCAVQYGKESGLVVSIEPTDGHWNPTKDPLIKLCELLERQVEDALTEDEAMEVVSELQVAEVNDQTPGAATGATPAGAG